MENAARNVFYVILESILIYFLFHIVLNSDGKAVVIVCSMITLFVFMMAVSQIVMVNSFIKEIVKLYKLDRNILFR